METKSKRGGARPGSGRKPGKYGSYVKRTPTKPDVKNGVIYIRENVDVIADYKAVVGSVADDIRAHIRDVISAKKTPNDSK